MVRVLDPEYFHYLCSVHNCYHVVCLVCMESPIALIERPPLSAFPPAANEDTPQVYALCGRGPRSSLRVLRHGLEVSEMAVSELPGNPNAVWTVRKRADGT